MPGPSPAKLGAVRTLIGAAPDHALRSLQAALAGAGGDGGAMALIREMIDTERADRALRAWVFGPIEPLFQPRADGVEAPVLPRRALLALWTLVKARLPELVGRAADDSRYLDPSDRAPAVFDDICRNAAALLRDSPEAVAPGDPAAAESVAVYLDLTPLARKALRRAPEWMSKVTDERIAAFKVVMSDATALVPDGTPRLFEIFQAHLPEAAQVLRLVALLTDRASDRYLASSELKSFGERVLAAIEARVQRVRTFDPQGGQPAGRAAAQEVIAACAALAEIEQSVDLSRDGPWGARVSTARKALALNVEGRLREVENAVAQALPMQAVRVAGRLTRPAPKVGADPDERLVAKAHGLVTFLEEARPAANAGGYGALRGQVAEKVAVRLFTYADELIEAMNAGEVPDEDRARVYLEIAAEFLALAKDAKAAQIVRRRAAVAGGRQPSKDVA
jgi:hypothetical protein